MNFGQAVAAACSTFAITNIDDIFVLVTFFAESSTNKSMTPFRIVLGQYIGFTAIIVVSLIGFGIAFVIPSEPIGFLGLLPILLGVWKILGLLLPKEERDDGDGVGEGARANRDCMRSVLVVASVTIMNGGDNIGTYIPMFSQVRGPQIAIFIVTYYILLGLWCLVAFLIMKQKHVLKVAEKYANKVVPFLYIGLGIFITYQSHAYPWSVKEINDEFVGKPGKIVMGVVTSGMLLGVMGIMGYFRWKKRVSKGDDLSDERRLENAEDDVECGKKVGQSSGETRDDGPSIAELGDDETQGNYDISMTRRDADDPDKNLGRSLVTRSGK
jgi:cadmium resistance protein CadD (predicted permease)